MNSATLAPVKTHLHEFKKCDFLPVVAEGDSLFTLEESHGCPDGCLGPSSRPCISFEVVLTSPTSFPSPKLGGQPKVTVLLVTVSSTLILLCRRSF